MMVDRRRVELPIAGVVGLTEAEQRRVRGGLSFSGASIYQNNLGSGAATARRALYSGMSGNRGYAGGSGGSA
jgi:hypothetical protein